MHLRVEALILAIRHHGEHGAIVRALTAEHGLQAGYVRGGRSTRIRPILQPANRVIGEWRARTDDQLASLTVELVTSRAPLYAEPLPALALEWVTTLTAAALPEAQPYPRLYAALDGTIGVIAAAPAARGWALALARYELLVLAELGYGLERETLPPALTTGVAPEWDEIFEALSLTGDALEASILVDRRAVTLAARTRLVERLKRAVA
ncbi:DNA repair protein RecO [Sphingomonas sp. 10B4]|uniref:DNA repair protein RecO n=1 Tax=Sphingomonas sp. 10B4 TaxID=3048575 RepID=UPI002AB3C91C|nr:recombination protein O N-terminal domain-containing protein [Sphingomonas sp. 10B4]MDY7523079.1 recombination protein O N-terminal domain-containing protein [Sphingomonas sp. 10B4]MEB0283444.1 recombination protein O N-terminal domain-containing protein [Sphingomonas sp. 10B4]